MVRLLGVFLTLEIRFYGTDGRIHAFSNRGTTLVPVGRTGTGKGDGVFESHGPDGLYPDSFQNPE